jgi:hypothetical protein
MLCGVGNWPTAARLRRARIGTVKRMAVCIDNLSDRIFSDRLTGRA